MENYKKTEHFEAIAMKCTNEQFEEIKPILEKFGFKYNYSIIKNCKYLTNFWTGEKNYINNAQKKHSRIDGIQNKYKQWNSEIFLKACGIHKIIVKLERNELILELYNQGVSQRKIAKQVGLSKSGVNRVVVLSKSNDKESKLSQKPIKLSLAIRNKLKQRKHMKELVEELKRDVGEANRIIERYENTIKVLNFELQEYDLNTNK